MTGKVMEGEDQSGMDRDTMASQKHYLGYYWLPKHRVKEVALQNLKLLLSPWIFILSTKSHILMIRVAGDGVAPGRVGKETRGMQTDVKGTGVVH